MTSVPSALKNRSRVAGPIFFSLRSFAGALAISIGFVLPAFTDAQLRPTANGAGAPAEIHAVNDSSVPAPPSRTSGCSRGPGGNGAGAGDFGEPHAAPTAPITATSSPLFTMNDLTALDCAGAHRARD